MPVTLVRMAAGHYGQRVTFALVHPTDLLSRCQQHTNAERVVRGERPRQMVAMR